MEVVYVPVVLHKLNASDQKRLHIGTTYFEVGSTVNDVLVFISERQRRSTGGAGLWLLQKTKDNDNSVPSGGGGDAVDGQDFVTIKDSKHKLQDGDVRYAALHFSAGADIFLM